MNKDNSILKTLFSILLGFLVGAIVLKVAGFSPIEGYRVIFEGVFGKSKYISWTIIKATPLILTGVSVAFAFKTGLFNIGAEGQFIIGSLVATLVGFFLDLPPVIHPIVAMLAGMIAAGIWAGIVGYLKAKLEINEVISSIMLNWVALYLSNYIVFKEGFKRAGKDASNKIMDSASINILQNWKASDAGKAFLKNNKFLKGFFDTPLNYGFIIAILAAILIWYILKNTTLGYRLKAVGYNKEAAEYGGIDIQRNTVTAMMIAGALSGLAGAVHVLGVTKEVVVLSGMAGYGFDGMAVSLIASNNPLACIPAALLFGGLQYGGTKLQPKLGAPLEVVNIIIGTIIFFIAMPKLMNKLAGIRKKKAVGDKNVK